MASASAEAASRERVQRVCSGVVPLEHVGAPHRRRRGTRRRHRRPTWYRRSRASMRARRPRQSDARAPQDGADRLVGSRAAGSRDEVCAPADSIWSRPGPDRPVAGRARRRRAIRTSAVSMSPSTRRCRLLRLRGEPGEPLRQRDQRRGQVAAVDGRDISGMKRRQRRRVVPVEEVALVPLQPFERRQRQVRAAGRALQWRCSRGRARPASTAAPCRCWSAMFAGRRCGSSSVFLIVVGRQPRVGLRHERFEVPPGLAGRPAQERALRSR